jgi:hypothetical protein
MLNNLHSNLGDVTTAYVGLTVLPSVAAALSRSAVAVIESVLPKAHTNNNPAHLGKNVDVRV